MEEVNEAIEALEVGKYYLVRTLENHLFVVKPLRRYDKGARFFLADWWGICPEYEDRNTLSTHIYCDSYIGSHITFPLVEISEEKACMLISMYGPPKI